MNEFLNEEQIEILIASLTDTIQEMSDEAKMAKSYAKILGNRLLEKEEEIATLRAKLRATKKVKATKEPKVALPAPVKRGRGRPKKAVK